MIRRSLSFLHRWLGLAMALCLLSACLTGAALAWKVELDEWLNPGLFRVPLTGAPPLDEDSLRAALLRAAPQARVRWIEPPVAAGRSALASVVNWRDPADPSRRLNEVFLDPTTGAVLGARNTTAPRPNRAEFVHWLRRFHYTLGLQRTGMVTMGIVALAWFADSLVGSVLTLPAGSGRWRRWLRTWTVRRNYLAYDLHRASSLWLWPLLIVLSASSVYLNLTQEVFMPAVNAVARLLPAAWRSEVVDGILEWQQPLHTGSAFGTAGRAVISVTGLVVSVGLIAALRSWWQRKQRNNRVLDSRRHAATSRLDGRG